MSNQEKDHYGNMCDSADMVVEKEVEGWCINVKDCTSPVTNKPIEKICSDGNSFYDKNYTKDGATGACVNGYYHWTAPAYKKKVAIKKCIPKVKLTSETVAILPSPRSRTTIGVGESVIIKSDVDVKFDGKGGDQFLYSAVGMGSKELKITAKDKAGSFTITAKATDGVTKPNTITLNIIEPSGLAYSHDPQLIYSSKKEFGAVVGLNIQVLPTHVNFENIWIRELDSASVNTGFWNDGKVYCHIEKNPNGHSSFPAGKQCMKIGDFSNIGSQNFAYHNGKKTYDKVGLTDNELRPLPLAENASMTISIPVEWSLTGSWKKLMTVTQKIVIEKNGDAIVSKGNYSKKIPFGQDLGNTNW